MRDVNKVLEGSPHIVDAMKEGRVAMVVNTPDASGTKDSFSIRRTALELRLPYFTTMAGAKAAVEGIYALKHENVRGPRAAGLPSKAAGGPTARNLRRAVRPLEDVQNPHLTSPREITGEGSEKRGLRIDTAVASMPGIGPKRAVALEARGIVTAGDLVFHLPVRYQDWRERTPPEDLRAGEYRRR